MQNLIIRNPHDRLFKQAFGHKKVMQDFLESRLPEKILKFIDFPSLRLANKSFTAKTGTEKHSDLIYVANIKDLDGHIYISLEHQSEEKALMPFRQLEYSVMLMKQHLDEGHKKLPFIVNICLYNGPKPYQGPTTLLESFECPKVVEECLGGAYQVMDLRVDSVEKIQQDKQAALAEMALKQGKSRDFCGWIDLHEELLSLLSGPYNKEVYDYIYSLDPNKNAILERIERLKDPEQRKIAMTAAQYLRQEGMQQGIQQGMQQGMQRGIQQGMQQGRQQGIQQGMQQGIQQGMQQGRQQGIQQGRQQGIQQGMQQGMQRGMQQGMHTKSLEIAKNMLYQGFAFNTIQEIAGISADELKQIEIEQGKTRA